MVIKFFLFVVLLLFNFRSTQSQTKSRKSKKELKIDVALQEKYIDSLIKFTQNQDRIIVQLGIEKTTLEDSIIKINNNNSFLLRIISNTIDTLNDYRNETALKEDTIKQLSYIIDSFNSFQNLKKTIIPYLKRGGKYIYVDTTNLMPMSNDEYDEAGLFNQYGLAIVGNQIGNEIKYGLINRKGEIILPIKYKYISDFKNHYGLAIIKSVEETNALGTEVFYIIIDSAGKVTGDKIYSYLELPMCDAAELTDFFSDKALFKISKRQKYGLLGSKLEELIPCTYDEIEINDNYILANRNGKSEIFDTTGKLIINSFYEINGWDYSEGLCPAVKMKKWGYLSKQSNWIIQPEYEGAGAFKEGLAPVKKLGKWGYIDKQGSVVIPFQYEYANGYCEGFATVKLHDKWIYINKKNDRLPNIFSEIDAYELNDGIGEEKDYNHSTEFANGLAAIRRNEKWDLINTAGKIVTTNSYDFISRFIGKSALVNLNGLYGIIDSAGKIVAHPIYEDINFLQEGLYKVKLNGKYSVINSAGATIIPPKYDDISYLSINLFGIELNNKWGIIDKNNKIISSFLYDEVNPFLDGFAVVKQNEKSIFIDEKGTEYAEKKDHFRKREF